MSLRGTITVFIIAAMVFLVVFYFMNDGDLTGWLSNNNGSDDGFENITPSCRSACVEKGYYNGQCIKGDSSLEFQNVCANKGWTDLSDRKLELSDCDFEAFAAWEVCCCYNN